MELEIFDVAHGACALLTCDDQSQILIDCGHNAATGWNPADCFSGRGIRDLEMLAITNYDEDHVRGLPEFLRRVSVRSLLRNTSVSSSVIKELKSNDGMGPGIDALCSMIDRYTGGAPSPPPGFVGLKRQVYWNTYPDFDDENNLSMVLVLECHGVSVMFCGDIELAGWEALLEDANFRTALSRVRILMAPHHGRESGLCDEAMELCKSLNYVVISDKGYAHDTQHTVPYYKSFCQGGPFRGDTRYVLTTRNDGKISFNFRPDGWGPR